jgi:hypothetical protein
MQADLCFDAATEGATGGMLVCCPPVVAAKRRAETPRRIPRPVNPSEVAIYPYTLVMTDEDTVLEEAMDNLKEAGQRIMATQSLMRSQGMTDGENHRDLLTSLSTALAMTEAAHLEPGVGGTSRAVALTRAMLHTCL